MRHPDETADLPGRDLAEGRSDMNLPGADRGDAASDELRLADVPDPDATPRPDREPPDAADADLPRRLGERIEKGPAGGVAGEPDLVPDVEVPEETM